MSDPQEQFNRGYQGQAPPSGGSGLDEWAKGDATRKWNQGMLGPQAGNGALSGMAIDGGAEPFRYTAPPDPRILSAGLFLAASFGVFCLSAPIFGTLYPIPTGAALITAFLSDGFLRHGPPHWDGSDRLPIEMLAGVVVFWITSRLDHRVAAYVAPYRYIRHVARVVLIALLVAMASLNPNGSLIPTTPWQAHAVASNPAFLPVVAVVAIVAHVGLTKWKGLRQKWDRGLEIYGLRPRGLPR